MIPDPLLTSLRDCVRGEYEVLDCLGTGGMASVFLARDLSLDRLVALKVMRPDLVATLAAKRRFVREAHLLARLNHPNIVAVHGVRQQGGLVFLDLRLVEGTPLDRLIAEHGRPIPADVSCWLIASIADALHYAHVRGVVHRDVKPGNVMVDARGEPRVTDFGIALAPESERLTGPGHIIGTPAYMSPEQCLDRSATPASDQYSLGVLAYELLTGRQPFSGSVLDVQRAHMETMPPPPHHVVDSVPERASLIVMRMLAKDPAARWPSLAEAAEALLGVLDAPDAPIRRRTQALVTVSRRLSPPGQATIRREEVREADQAASTEVLSERTKAARQRRARQRAVLLPAALAAVLLLWVAIRESDPVQGDLALATQGARGLGRGPFADHRWLADTALDVIDTTLYRVAVEPMLIRIAVGDSMALRATASGVFGEPLRRRYRWRSDDTASVHVSPDGWIHAVASGQPVFVFASTGGVSGAALITVVPEL